MRRHQQGFQLLELIVVLALVGLSAAAGIPHLLRASAGGRVRLAAAELVSALRLARAYAVRHSANVGVKFVEGEGGRVTYTLYRDGDGDGVRSRDIERGVDPPTGPARLLERLGPRVGLGFPPGRPPRDPSDPSRRLDRLDDPIRFNRSNIASFGPLGSATPGSLYLTDHREHLAAVRVTGRSGRIRMLVYDREAERWH